MATFMYIVYRKDNKTISNIHLTPKDNLVHENICPDKNTDDYGCFKNGYIEDVYINYHLYTINDSDENNIFVEKTLLQKRIVIECNKTLLSENKYSMAHGEIANITVRIKDSEDNLVNVSGNLELYCSRGVLSNKTFVLDNESSINTTWQSVSETVECNFWAYFPSERPPHYKPEGNMVISLI